MADSDDSDCHHPAVTHPVTHPVPHPVNLSSPCAIVSHMQSATGGISTLHYTPTPTCRLHCHGVLQVFRPGMGVLPGAVPRGHGTERAGLLPPPRAGPRRAPGKGRAHCVEAAPSSTSWPLSATTGTATATTCARLRPRSPPSTTPTRPGSAMPASSPTSAQRVHMCSKALESTGGVILCNKTVRAALAHFSRCLTYSGAPSVPWSPLFVPDIA